LYSDKIKGGDDMSWTDVFQHFFEEVFKSPAVKIIAGFFIGLLQLCYGPVIRPAYIAIPILCGADFITGYYHARENPQIVPSSAKLKSGLVKLFIYAGVLLVGYQYSKFPLISFLQGVLEGAIILTEGYSVLENLEKIMVLKGKDNAVLKLLMAKIKGKTEEITK